jgi:beta-glucosidase
MLSWFTLGESSIPGDREGRVPRFPSTFLWGATTSAHAVEGGDFACDWWRWEQRPGRIRDGSTSDPAAGHYARYSDDLALAHKLGQNAHCFTLNWSRIQPAPDRFDDDAIQHYGDVLDALDRHGMTPVCALQHAALPEWFAAKGGWLNPEATNWFGAYAKRIATDLGDRAPWWIPIVEPMHALENAFLTGAWPPGRTGVCRAYSALRILLQAQTRAYRTFHEACSDVQVGLAIRGRSFQPRDELSSWDLRVARKEHHRCNQLIPRALHHGRWRLPGSLPTDVRGTFDFIAVSYLGANTVRFSARHPRRVFAICTDDSGQAVDPDTCTFHSQGFYDLLLELNSYGTPILVTGNGISTNEDTERCTYLLDHVDAVERAVAHGADVRGYFHRSLLDGFEWTAGYTARYGLIHVDRETGARTPNTSAYLLKDIAGNGGIRTGAVEQYSPGWIPTPAEVPA